MNQLSMFEIFEPLPAPIVAPVRWCDLPRHKTMGRAYGEPREFTVTEGDPYPFEMEVRGIPCTITAGFATYVIDGPGSLFWSETGYRSFGYGIGGAAHQRADEIRAMIERYIDAPAKDGNGCGGTLVRWWPCWVRQWQSDVHWGLTMPRATTWDQWGPEKHADCWARHDARRAEAEACMWAEGIDPNDVGKPAHHKGTWPKFSPPSTSQEQPA